ncbi:hypothetical protein SZ54_2043 [Rhizobium sp. UR51a]|nr:hypothetical protein SZ54_2043 [Rhizobium sp. UR51a]
MRPAYPEEPAHSCFDLKAIEAAWRSSARSLAARHWRRTAIFGRIT